MAKLAVRKEPANIPGAGFHYMLFPLVIDHPAQVATMELTGHIIIEVEDEVAQRLVEQAKQALYHQIEIAKLTDAAEYKRWKEGHGDEDVHQV